MIYDDSRESPSDSPVVSTPDMETFEGDMMLDDPMMRTFYNQDEIMVSTQMQQDPILAQDASLFFPNQGMVSSMTLSYYANAKSSHAGCIQYVHSDAKCPVPNKLQLARSTVPEHDWCTTL